MAVLVGQPKSRQKEKIVIPDAPFVAKPGCAVVSLLALVFMVVIIFFIK